MDNMTKMHKQHAEDHEARLSHLQSSHQEEIQGVKGHYQTELEAKEQAYKTAITALEDKVKALESPSSSHDTQELTTKVESLTKEVVELKVKNVICFEARSYPVCF